MRGRAMIFNPVPHRRLSPGPCGPLGRHPPAAADTRQFPAYEAVKRKVQATTCWAGDISSNVLATLASKSDSLIHYWWAGSSSSPRWRREGMGSTRCTHRLHCARLRGLIRCRRFALVLPKGAIGKAVRIRRDPVTVFGDETRESHWPERAGKARGVGRSESQETCRARITNLSSREDQA